MMLFGYSNVFETGGVPTQRNEIAAVADRAVAKVIPMACVTNPQAKVTHEAAISSVDRHQMETLMAHGLTPEEAVDVIVKGILG